MKKYLPILIAVLSIGSADAASVVLSKGTGVGINVLTGGGAPLTTFNVFVGTFAAAPTTFTAGNYLDVVQSFRAFGSASSPATGLATATIERTDFTTVPASNFNNQQIYLFVADNADLTKATQIGLYTKSATRTDWVFPADTPGALANIGASTINFGAVSAIGDSGVVDNATGPDSFRLIAIPETSSSLLIGLSMLGLIARRKR